MLTPKTIINVGDVLEVLQTLPDESVQCAVTSPPYWGLRNYGVSNQLGLEDTPEEYIHNMVQVFREVRRVLADDGIFWLNIADTYSGSGRGPTGENGIGNQTKRQGFDSPKVYRNIPRKNLIGIPWRLALALQEDGWFLRDCVIWHKSNPMPESVKDRCTRSYEFVFMFTKNPKYLSNFEAIKEPAVTYTDRVRDRDKDKLNNTLGRSRMSDLTRGDYDKKNKRNVWTIPTARYKGTHFAVMPEELVEYCVKASITNSSQVVLDPFGGSGTVAVVANRLGCSAKLIEINPVYARLAEDRIKQSGTKDVKRIYVATKKL